MITNVFKLRRNKYFEKGAKSFYVHPFFINVCLGDYFLVARSILYLLQCSIHLVLKELLLPAPGKEDTEATGHLC